MRMAVDGCLDDQLVRAGSLHGLATHQPNIYRPVELASTRKSQMSIDGSRNYNTAQVCFSDPHIGEDDL